MTRLQWIVGCLTVLAGLGGCASTPGTDRAAFRHGADAALAAVARRYQARQRQALLAPGHTTPDPCGATGRHTRYGTLHIAGGLHNGMWVPPQDVVVVYRGQVVTPGCPAPTPPQTEGTRR